MFFILQEKPEKLAPGGKEAAMKFGNLKAEVPEDIVLKRLECTPDSRSYGEFREELLEIREELERRLVPQGAFAFGTLPEELATEEIPEGSRVACVIVTVGKGISDYCSEFFQKGDCVKGMLADAYADTFLFEVEKCWLGQLTAVCKEKGVGIKRRLEIPEELPMEAQKFAYETIGRNALPKLRLTDGFMFEPVKTICHLFLLTEEEEEFHTEHSCRRCSNVSCDMRGQEPVRITVVINEDRLEAICRGEERILEVLAKEGIAVSAVCGGHGNCGKCRIRLLSGETAVTRQEKAFFSEKELEAGWRLACQAYPLTDCEIELPATEEEFQILSSGEGTDKKLEKERADTKTEKKRTGRKGERHAARAEDRKEREKTESAEYGIAADIGTTTLAVQLVRLDTGEILDTEVSVNHQRSYGADVLSRIQASNEGRKKELQESIQKDLWGLFERLIEKSGVSGEKVSEICMAGNTAMVHLLLGYSCEELGRLPFRPVTLEPPVMKAADVFGSAWKTGRAERGVSSETRTRLLPGIAAFVGGDITAGLLSCDFDQEEGACLLLDFGTNGEIALGGKDRIFVTSAAAGPAFEGGSISWGCGSVPGAVCHVRIGENGQAEAKTIGERPPVGICGTGLIETAAELLRCGFMDETGRLAPEYAKTGFPIARTVSGEPIVLTQKDIRELQLAKAAMRAGLEILLSTAGMEYKDVRLVWLAGGFGYFMDWNKAAAIGLLPKSFLDRVQIAGNSSLTGARLALTKEGAWERIRRLRSVAKEVRLGGRKEFQEAYVDAMRFGQR